MQELQLRSGGEGNVEGKAKIGHGGHNNILNPLLLITPLLNKMPNRISRYRFRQAEIQHPFHGLDVQDVAREDECLGCFGTRGAERAHRFVHGDEDGGAVDGLGRVVGGEGGGGEEGEGVGGGVGGVERGCGEVVRSFVPRTIVMIEARKKQYFGRK